MIDVFIILALILLNGVLSMSEIALISARKSRLESDAKKGSHRARTALQLAENPDRFLSTIQIGITLVGILTGLYSGDRIAQRFGTYLAALFPSYGAVAVSVAQTFIIIVVTYLTLIFGELVPKRIGMNAAERMARMVAPFMAFLSRIGTPFVWLLAQSTNGILHLFNLHHPAENKVTEEDIRAFIQESTDEGEIEPGEQDLVERVFTLNDRNVGSIMTHRSELVWLEEDACAAEIRDKVHTKLFNAYPVANGSLDHITGVVYLKDLFGKLDQPDFQLSTILRKPKYLPEKLSVYQALEQMRAEEVKYGLVTDEFGSIEGIVTLKDIVQALLGNLPASHEEAEIIPRHEGGYLVDGQCSFYDFLEYFDQTDLYEQEHYNTVSGLLLDQLKHIPATGEELQWKGFSFEVVDMDGPRIDKVLVQLVASPNTPSA